MIPEDQLIAVRREILRAIANKFGKRRRLGHRLVAHVRFQTLQLTVFHAVDLVDLTADTLRFPACASAGIHDDIHVVAVARSCNLGEVGRCHAASGFEVRTAEIDHHCDLILIIAEDFCALIAGTGCNRIVNRSGIRHCVLLLLLRFLGMIRKFSPAAAEQFGDISAAAEQTAAAASFHQEKDQKQKYNRTAAAGCCTLACTAAAGLFAGVSVLRSDRTGSESVTAAMNAGAAGSYMLFATLRTILIHIVILL